MKKSESIPSGPMRAALVLFICLLGTVGSMKLYSFFHTQKEIADLEKNILAGQVSHANQYQNYPSPNGFESAAEKIMPSVVSIDTLEEKETWHGDTFQIPGGSGSGVIVSEQGYIVTNHHVIKDATGIYVHVNRPDAKKKIITVPYPAKVIGIDRRSDLAVLKINAPNLTPVQMGSAKSLRIGDWVMAVGNPLGFNNTLSVGVISNIGRNLPTEGSVLTDAIQTDASINQGNSGGALANKYGQLVGINTAIATKTGGSVGIGFAIPIERVQSVIKDIYQFGRVRYGWIGMEVFDPRIFRIRLNRMKLERFIGHQIPEKGLVIKNVEKKGPAYQAGIRAYGVIKAINGDPVDDMLDYLIALSEKKPGDIIEMIYWNSGIERKLTITLSDPL